MSSPINIDQLTFPKASARAAEVLSCLSKADPNLEKIDHLIMQDPLLAGTLIRYANSPLYRRGGEVSNVPTATRLIGLKNVRSAVVMSILHASLPMDAALSRVIMGHLLNIAAFCKLIARRCCPQSADELELMGLIHDVGMVVLATNFQAEYKVLVTRSRQEGVALDVLEASTFGVSRDKITAKALHEFRLPKRHENVLVHFHQSNGGDGLEPDMVRERAVLLLAHYLNQEVCEEGQGEHSLRETLTEPRESLIHLLGFDEQALSEIISQAGEVLASNG